MATSKKSIECKQIGQNLNVVVDGNKITRKITDKEEREHVKTLIADYNKKNSAAKQKEILSIMTVGKVEKKAEKEVKAIVASPSKVKKEKVVKAQSKKVDKKVAQKAEEAKKSEPVVQKASVRRSGEY